MPPSVTAIDQAAPPLMAQAAVDGDAIFAEHGILARYAAEGVTLSDSLPSVRVLLSIKPAAPDFARSPMGQRSDIGFVESRVVTLSCPSARDGDSDAGGGVTATGPGDGKRVVRLTKGDRFVVPGWAVGRATTAVCVVAVTGNVVAVEGFAWNAHGNVGDAG